MAQVTFPAHYARIVLAEHPKTYITPTTFRRETVPFDLEPGLREILVQVNWLSIDPALRTWLGGAYRYLPPPQIGAVMQSHGLGTVVEAGEGCELRLGDIVSGRPGKSTRRRGCPFFAVYIAARLGGVRRYEGGGSNSKNSVSTTMLFVWLG